jgi:tRNA modification GTPase
MKQNHLKMVFGILMSSSLYGSVYGAELISSKNMAAVDSKSDFDGDIGSTIAGEEEGNAIKNGVPVVIVGKPNAGKSTLLNALLQEEKAIVSAIAGTTRDTIEDEINIGGLQFRFIDTAGLRDTADEIESIGVSRARIKMQEASIILYLEDLSMYDAIQWLEAESELLALNKPVLKVGNKIDLLTNEQIRLFEEENWFLLSAAKGQNVEALKDELLRLVQIQSINPDQTIITNQRHFQALEKSRIALSHALYTLQTGLQTEIVAADLKEGLFELGSITGEVTNEDILGSIFGRFCIGK